MQFSCGFVKLTNEFRSPLTLARRIQNFLAADELFLNLRVVERLHGSKVIFVVRVQQVILFFAFRFFHAIKERGLDVGRF